MYKLILLSLLFISCVTNSKEEEYYPVIPDRTPYISGLLEATKDTVHHFPEVVIGYLTNVKDENHSDFIRSSKDLPELYNIEQLSHLLNITQVWLLTWEEEQYAKVRVTGPIGLPSEQTVEYEHQGGGVYGDVNLDLDLIPEGVYRLDAELPDGRIYSSITTIPGKTEITIPDSITVQVEYAPYMDGTPREKHTSSYPVLYKHPEHYNQKILQLNTSLDRELLLMEDEEVFPFFDRAPYLHIGIMYSIGMVDTIEDTFNFVWGQDLNKPKEEIWQKQNSWLRFSFFNDGLGEFYMPPVGLFSVNGDEWHKREREHFDAYMNRDSTYLFDVSTILKVDDNGDVLPKEESDAIGFFGGYFSVYKQTTLYPIRNFDLDSVLTAHGYN